MADQPHTMPLSQWRLRLTLYLVWVGGGSLLASIPTLEVTDWKSVATCLLGLVIAVVGQWRAFLDKSTPETK